MSSAAISARQNEEEMLRFQFASRKYYNRAEFFDILIWATCFIAWLTILLPSDGVWGTIVPCITTALDIAILIFFWRLSENVRHASSLRAYFDSYVLGIPCQQYSTSDRQELVELALDAAEKSPHDYATQIANSGHDIPPGVRDWYEFSHACDGLSAVFICQKQNCWWTKKVSHAKRIVSIVTTILFTALFCFVAYAAWPQRSGLQILLSVVGIVLKIIERVVAKHNYRRISEQLTGATKALENNLTAEGIESLQKLINERRSLPVLESNIIHKFKAKVFSARYLKLPQ